MFENQNLNNIEEVSILAHYTVHFDSVADSFFVSFWKHWNPYLE